MKRAGWVFVPAVAVVAALLAGTASATFPGKPGRIAFGVIGADRNVDVYSIEPDGSDYRRLTDHSAFDACPAYSPDGKSIAFCSDRSGSFQIWVMGADGANQHQVTTSRHDALFPSFSKDGRRIAFQADDGSPASVDIYLVATRGGKITRLTGAPGEDTDASFSPDGKLIAFLSHRKGRPQIWLMRASDGHDQRPLVKGGAPQGAPDWSPDGKRIAYDASGDIWVIAADGSNPVNLTRTPAAEYGATWSPNGKQVAFVAQIPGKGKRVYVMDADGSGRRLLGGSGQQHTPSWAPAA